MHFIVSNLIIDEKEAKYSRRIVFICFNRAKVDDSREVRIGVVRTLLLVKLQLVDSVHL